jgi:phosphopantothenoylcysteine decarboxylase/phosphopantothenate--cysteine ligase
MPKQRISDTGVEAKSTQAKGRRIALGICGGIAAVESVKIIRELRRHGARVTPFFTPSVTAFIGELSVEWAAGEKVVLQTGADVDHLQDFDLVVVAPATLNTIAKSALAICDNAVSLLVAGQLGRRGKLLFVPTMNLDLQQHPAYPEYVKRLEGWGAKFFACAPQESRLKMPAPEEIAERVLELLA